MEIINMCYIFSQSIDNIDHTSRKCSFVQGIRDHKKFNCHTPLSYKGEFLSCLEMLCKNYKNDWRHMSNASIIITECMMLRDNVMVVKISGFLNLEIV